MSLLKVTNITDTSGSGSAYAKGHVVQVVTVNANTEISSTSSTAVSTGLTALITPKFNTSRIAIFTTFPAQNDSTSTASAFTVFRGTVSDVNLGITGIGSFPGFAGVYSASGAIRSVVSIHHVDTPNTTTETRYTVGFFGQTGGARVMHEGRRGTLTLMEIAQ